jgi:hypothetical protein
MSPYLSFDENGNMITDLTGLGNNLGDPDPPEKTPYELYVENGGTLSEEDWGLQGRPTGPKLQSVVEKYDSFVDSGAPAWATEGVHKAIGSPQTWQEAQEILNTPEGAKKYVDAVKPQNVSMEMLQDINGEVYKAVVNSSAVPSGISQNYEDGQLFSSGGRLFVSVSQEDFKEKDSAGVADNLADFLGQTPNIKVNYFEDPVSGDKFFVMPFDASTGKGPTGVGFVDDMVTTSSGEIRPSTDLESFEKIADAATKAGVSTSEMWDATRNPQIQDKWKAYSSTPVTQRVLNNFVSWVRYGMPQTDMDLKTNPTWIKDTTNAFSR